jgi:hypothetical protein
MTWHLNGSTAALAAARPFLPAGAFLACMKLKAQVPCRELFYEVYHAHIARAAATAPPPAGASEALAA